MKESWMIIENTADPAMINTILLSHLLFINSLSAIIAGAEMKRGREATGRGSLLAAETEWENGSAERGEGRLGKSAD